MALKQSQKDLKNWSAQKWRTKSGKKSSVTGERYLPESVINRLSSKEYARTTAKKRKNRTRAKYSRFLRSRWIWSNIILIWIWGQSWGYFSFYSQK